MDEKLEELRSEIDKIDEEIIVLFSERQKVAKQIGFLKKENGLAIIDEERKKTALQKRLELAKEIGLPEADIRELFELLHKKAVEIQKEV